MKMNCSENDKIFEKLLNHEISIAVVGIGYVGYHLVQLLSQKFKVIAYDIDEERVSQLKVDNALFTCCESDMKKAAIYIITVPTPINQ